MQHDVARMQTKQQKQNKTELTKKVKKNTKFLGECVSQRCPCYLLMGTATGLFRNNRWTLWCYNDEPLSLSVSLSVFSVSAHLLDSLAVIPLFISLQRRAPITDLHFRISWPLQRASAWVLFAQLLTERKATEKKGFCNMHTPHYYFTTLTPGLQRYVGCMRCSNTAPSRRL